MTTLTASSTQYPKLNPGGKKNRRRSLFILQLKVHLLASCSHFHILTAFFRWFQGDL
uniref:Uncharacterized protein n=1 Tax=Arundo donax TaxID=35708 RepID=A0A0A9DR08_ARUDO